MIRSGRGIDVRAGLQVKRYEVSGRGGCAFPRFRAVARFGSRFTVQRLKLFCLLRFHVVPFGFVEHGTECENRQLSE